MIRWLLASALWLPLGATASAQGIDAGVDAGMAVEDPGAIGDRPQTDAGAPGETPEEAPSVADAGAAVPSAHPSTGVAEPHDDPTGYDVSAGATGAPGEERSLAEDAPVEPEDIVLFVPRAILFVPKLILTGIFWPIRELMSIVDRHAVIEHIEEVIYWNEAHTLGLVPAFSIQSRFGFTAGFDFFHDDLLGYEEELAVKARFGGRYSQAYELSLVGARVAGSRLWLETRARFEENPELFFAGLGVTDQEGAGPGLDPRAATAETYYREQRFLGLLRAGITLGNRGAQVQLGGSAIVNRRSFADAVDSDVLGTGAVFDTAAIPAFEDDATTFELDGNVVVDTRNHEGLDSRGVYLSMFGGYAIPVQDYSYVHYGAELAWTIDLFRGTRLLVLRGGLEAVHGEDDEIPFTDLPRLGGADRLRGYGEGRFRDRVAVFGTVEYRYPIHRNLMGYLFLDAGHAAREYGALFDDVRFGGGGGFLFGDAESIALRLDLSYGEDFNVFLSTDLASAFTTRGTQL